MNNLVKNVLTCFFSFTSLYAIAKDETVIPAGDIEWGMLNPARGEASPKAFDLWGDRTKNQATGMLVKFNKGFSSPPHIHNISYRGIVIEGLLHNDDPNAAKMWLPTGSFWTQPAGEAHITAANAQTNLIYLEINQGPYLVEPITQAFDNGERPINIDVRNLVWLGENESKWIEAKGVQIAYLWGQTNAANGSFIKLPAGFKGAIKNKTGLKAVVIKGNVSYHLRKEKRQTDLSPSSFFSSSDKGKHKIESANGAVIYIHSEGAFFVDD